MIFPSGWSGRRIRGSRPTRARPGVDEVSIEEFEQDLKRNLYKLWNRMSSGSYFPPPVRAVEIPKAGGTGSGCSVCPLWRTGSPRRWSAMYAGAEGGADLPPGLLRLPAGTVRAGRGGTCRERCWRTDWVIDLDIRAFFDSVAVGSRRSRRWSTTPTSGGFVLYVQTVAHRAVAAAGWRPWSSGIAEPRRGRRSRPCWLICSCTCATNAGEGLGVGRPS